MVEQVGGSHYGDTDYKHWDWVIAIGMQYLEGNATKYVARYDKGKGTPLQDLKKAMTYVQKIEENFPLCLRLAKLMRASPLVIQEETERFAQLNKIDRKSSEYVCLLRLATWETRFHLASAKALIQLCIDKVERTPVAKPVPLEDSNKHAERA